MVSDQWPVCLKLSNLTSLPWFYSFFLHYITINHQPYIVFLFINFLGLYYLRIRNICALKIVDGKQYLVGREFSDFTLTKIYIIITQQQLN